MWMRKATRELDLTKVDLKPDAPEGSLLDRSASSVTGMLSRFREDESAFERDIADLTERLRQTRVAITAFESAGAIIEGGKQPTAIAPDPDKVGRLVPRRSMREMAEADIVVDDNGHVLKSPHETPPIVHVHKDIRT